MLDLDVLRTHFPAFDDGEAPVFFENAGGSFPCRQTIDRLHRFYTDLKVQPYARYARSARAGEAMDAAYERWASALGVAPGDVVFGPSTSANTYVLAHAFGELLGAGDEVIVTDQDHEANTGALRRAATAAGARLLEWQIDPVTGLLEIDRLDDLLSERTRVLAFPHCSNIVGAENDVATICAMAHAVGARTIVDGVSFAPHGLPDVDALGTDIYLFSLYKTYSVHQGLMVVGESVAEMLPNQGHVFNAGDRRKRLAPAGPDHAQVAASVGVLDYIEATCPTPNGGLYEACRAATALWQAHEHAIIAPLLSWLDEHPQARLLGPVDLRDGLHRCPTVAFVPRATSSQAVSDRLADDGIMASWGNFYAPRVLSAMGVDPDGGVVRLSAVHYTSPADVGRAIAALEVALAG